MYECVPLRVCDYMCPKTAALAVRPYIWNCSQAGASWRRFGNLIQVLLKSSAYMLLITEQSLQPPLDFLLTFP